MGGFGELLDRVQSAIPLSGEVGHRPGGLVEPNRLHLVEDLSTVFASADQPGLFEHDEMLRDRLAGERDPTGQPARARLTVTNKKVEDPAARWVRDR